MPKGGLGNLIALPLQKNVREKGGSVFLDSSFCPYHDQWKFLSSVRKMGVSEVEKIVQDAEKLKNEARHSIDAGRSPLVLTERTEHVAILAEYLEKIVKHVIVLKGGMGKKQRMAASERLKSISDNEERVIVATGRYIGEGFDDTRLDTLFLAFPISWRGPLQQYAGRLHRLYEGKHEVRIYDFVDKHVPTFSRMYQKRLKGYYSIGYSIQEQVKQMEFNCLKNVG